MAISLRSYHSSCCYYYLLEQHRCRLILFLPNCENKIYLCHYSSQRQQGTANEQWWQVAQEHKSHSSPCWPKKLLLIGFQVSYQFLGLTSYSDAEACAAMVSLAKKGQSYDPIKKKIQIWVTLAGMEYCDQLEYCEQLKYCEPFLSAISEGGMWWHWRRYRSDLQE